MGKTFKDKNSFHSTKKKKTNRQRHKTAVSRLSNKKGQLEETYNNLELDDMGDGFEKFDRKRR
tara:strand:+ start:647 stop:835 length:189 start_codon:yes stop_codon:yes gene_type:complete